MVGEVRYDVSRLTDDDLFLFNEGNHFRLYDKLGSRPMTVDGGEGTYFAVWAPDAEKVFVMGDFNGCLLYTSPSPRDATLSRMPSSA